MNYELIVFDITDYSKYIPASRYWIIEEAINALNDRFKDGNIDMIDYHDQIVRQLVILEVIIENGGIYIDQDIILTEDFSWINHIHSNKYVNAKQWIKKAEFIGFHSNQFSPSLKKH